MTDSLYVIFFPSRVILLIECSVSLDGGIRGGLVVAMANVTILFIQLGKKYSER